MKIAILETIAKLFADMIALFLAFSAAYYFRLFTFSSSLFPFETYITMSLVIIPLWIVLLGIAGRYSLGENSLLSPFRQIFFASLSCSLLFPLIFYFANDRFFSRGIIILLFVFSFLFLAFVNFLEQTLSVWRAKMLVIGANRDTERIIVSLQRSFSRHIPVAILAPYGSKQKSIHGVPIVGKLDALEKTVADYEIDEIFICEGVEHSENIASFCRNKGIPLKISIETLGMNTTSINPEKIGETVFLTMQQSPLFGWGQFFKRLFDVVFAIGGLLIFSPILLWYWKNRTEVVFQKNSTETFRAFCIVKNNTYAYKNWTLLWNVLKKDISVVGPRLFLREEYKSFFKEMRAGKQARTLLRSGIFSPSQYLKTPEEVLKSDVDYIQNWTFQKDIAILFSPKSSK